MAEIKIEDGGFAFPGIIGPPSEYVNGMSLRDWFAGQIAGGIMSQAYKGPKDWTVMGHGWGEDTLNHLNKDENHVALTIAGFSYAVADAMLAARKAGQS